jgi:hypothetical protein
LTAARSRAQLHRYATTYEVVAETPAGTIRLGFTARPGKVTFIHMAREHADALLSHLTDDDTTTYSAARGLRLGAAVLVRTSGRTERECAGEETR